MRYYDPIKGKVTFDGQDIREFKPSSWRNLIGVVPQVGYPLPRAVPRSR